MKLGKETIKDRIINYLLLQKDFVSGDAIAKEIGVSRTIINRYIKELIREGFDIESRKKEGYKLVSYQDVLYSSLINFRLSELSKKYSIMIFDELDSTNTYCLKNFDKMNDCTVVIAKTQRKGKGRFGREWVSEEDKDITMSILLKPNSEVNVLKYIISSSLAVLRTLRNFDVSDLFIKWPNDIYYKDKKLCGILTETSIEMTSKVVEAVVIGIGLNVNSTISQRVKNAISLYEILGFQVKRVSIISQILSYFDEFVNTSYDSLFSEWKENMGYLGEEVIVKKGDEEIECRFVDVSRSGEIVVEKDRRIMMFSFGEITLRRS
jgi:BirA family biotin operon repressor/biotin-[acetyl-CoA-carboxylase] ligase